MQTLKKSFAAGMMIAVGAAVYLSCENKIVGSLLFSLGLFAICSFGMFLFTGKIGYIIETKNKPNCLMIWIGNLLGSIVASLIIRIGKPSLHTAAANLVANKLELNLMSAMLLAFMCGILMYLAVDNFVKRPHTISGIVGIFLCVSVFILSGFEHSIADMNYFVLGITSLQEVGQCFLFLIAVSVFNGLGSLSIKYLIS